MKIQYFPDTDTLHIALSERDSDSAEALSENLVVDFDGEGKPVALTLEHYSQISDTTAIETLLPLVRTAQPA
jgi:uncharacterized protein YuzE